MYYIIYEQPLITAVAAIGEGGLEPKHPNLKWHATLHQNRTISDWIRLTIFMTYSDELYHVKAI